MVTTSRNGHELENYGYKNYNDKIQGKKKRKADPYKIEQDSTLLKLSFNPTENHRFTFAADLYEHRSRGQDLSYTLKYQRSGNETLKLILDTPMIKQRDVIFHLVMKISLKLHFGIR